MLCASLLKQLVREGTLEVIDAAGRRHRFAGAPGITVAVRLHDRKTERRLLWNETEAVIPVSPHNPSNAPLAKAAEPVIKHQSGEHASAVIGRVPHSWPFSNAAARHYSRIPRCVMLA